MLLCFTRSHCVAATAVNECFASKDKLQCSRNFCDMLIYVFIRQPYLPIFFGGGGGGGDYQETVMQIKQVLINT